MDFGSFLCLLIISVAVSAILHFGFKYYATPGPWSFVSKIVVGYVGARFGGPLLGKWWVGVNYGDVFFIPAILGAAALIVLAVDVAKMFMPAGKS